jgi:hypothetical protein
MHTTLKRLATFATALWFGASASAAAVLYANNFEQAELNQVPSEFLVLDGQFAVKQEADNKFFELPGAPLETYGFLFGPSQSDGLVVTARVFGTSRGRKFPTFAVSLNGVSGYRLQVAPAKKALELLKGDTIQATAPLEWASGQWTVLKLQVLQVKDAWKVSGKVWTHGGSEPTDWTLSWEEKEKPVPGRPGAWGSPFSGTPIRFDNLGVMSAENP